MKYLKLFLLASALLLSLGYSTASAQTASPSATSRATPSPTPLIPDQLPPTGVNLTISPPFVNVVTDPGVPVSTQLKIRNNNNFKEYLKFTYAKFTANETGDRPRLEAVGPEDEFINWISISEPSFAVEPNEQKTVKLTLSPARDAALGYYYAILVERVQDKTPGPGQETVARGAPAFLVILEVRHPNARKEIQLLDFKTSSPWYEYLPSRFEIKFKNIGNIHVVPAGDIFIDWGGKKDIGIVPANPGRSNILPGTIRTFYSEWDDGFIVVRPKIENDNVVRDETGNVEYYLDINWGKLTDFRIGKYTAHLLAVYDNGQRDIPLEATVSFWIIPWKIILAALLVVLLVLLGLKSSISSVVKKIRGNRPRY